VRTGSLALLCGAALTLSSPAEAQPSPDPDPWFGTDKALHFGAGLGFSAAGYGVGVAGFDDRWAGLALGAGLALTVGAAKEGIDAAGFGSPSWRDFAWVAVGTALGLGISVTFDAALRGAEL
jgi:putative lipoprotein